jgi:hypothetical protein
LNLPRFDGHGKLEEEESKPDGSQKETYYL